MVPEFPYHPRIGSIGWTCPSNIALIKYWGKKSGQYPMNPSLSMTLQEASTSTTVSYSFDPGQNSGQIRFRFDGKEAPEFERRIATYLEGLEGLLPFLSHTRLDIDSSNTFPHSSGIASSASSMGALALCLATLEEELLGSGGGEAFRQKASRLARLGSGSASRSVYPQFALWGKHPLWKNSSDEFAVPVDEFHGNFHRMRDAILLVETGKKKISSSIGHALMETNPFGKIRFQQARDNLELLHRAMSEGDWPAFISIMEEEALTLHAMMMTSRPGYLLMQPGTLSVLQRIREYREETRYRLGFTLDAGANVHLLYAEADADQVEAFVDAELLRYCEKGRVIWDRMGMGPKKIER